jgi:hypothetical protein
MTPDELVVDVIQYTKYTKIAAGLIGPCELETIANEITDFMAITASVLPAPDMGDYLLASQWVEWEMNGFDAANQTSQADSDAVVKLLAQRGVTIGHLGTLLGILTAN